MDVSESKEKLTEPESVAENSPTEANEEEAKLKDGDVGDSKFNGEKEKSDAKNVENVSTVESETQETKETVTSKEIKKLVEDNTKDESLQTADQGLGTAEVGSEDVGETIENVVTQDTPVQTEGRESPSKTSDNEKGAGTDSRSESEAPLVAPPTSKAEHSTVSESPGRQVPISTKDGSDVTVKFMIMPEGQVVSMSCFIKQEIGELRKHFSAELNQPPNVILILYDDKLLGDSSTLAELGIKPGESINMEIQSAEPASAPLKYCPTPPRFQLPSQITVKVKTDGKPVEIVVHVVQEMKKKPFLGGYKHRLSGIEFHNAAAQTMPKVRVPSPIERFHRDTQTYKMRNRVQQTTNTTSTQMTKPGCYVTNMTDKILIPGKYTTAEQHHKMILKKVIILQTYWRRWLAKKYVDSLRRDKVLRLEWERQEELRKQREKAERIKREWERRLNPKTKEDFDLLYATLEKWRKEEMARIDELYSGPQRKAALVGLLEQEAYLIASIDRHKLQAGEENQDKRIKSFMDKAAAPKRWKGFDGKITEMDTPYTIRAQELRDIYNTLSMKYLTQDERLDVLLTLKHTVKEHDCKLTQEIIELIDREADLLMRGVKESNLEGLRKRVSTLFLQYCKTPLFNPEAAKLIKVPQDPAVLRKNVYFCPSCNLYLPSTEFKLASNSRAVGRCRRCLKLDNDARLRQDSTQYRAMLKELRRVEESYDDGSRIALLLQEPDLRYLVENIWNSQSALSAHDDLFDLVLVRWNKLEEWSPWNCILLTKEEASAHDKLQNANEAYGRMFIGKILHKHVLARNYFSRLPGMAEHMKTKIAGQNTGLHQGPKATSLRA